MGRNIKDETIEYDYKLVEQYNRVREKENGPYAYKHIKKKKNITKENDFELWLELQAMNCIYIIYHDEIENDDELKSGLFSKKKKVHFEMPIEDYNGITYKCSKILDGDDSVYNDILDEMEDICQENNLNQKDKERVKELYPYLYAYILLLNTDDVEEKELENIISKFSKTFENEPQEELVVQSSKTVLPEEELVVQSSKAVVPEGIKNEEVVPNEEPKIQADEKIDIIFNNDYLNYRNGKYEGQEEGDYVYSNKLTGELICRENDNNLWLELQAMNFINKLFKHQIKEIKEYNSEIENVNNKKTFKVPEKEKLIAIKLYTSTVDENELKDYLYNLCRSNNVKETGIEKVYELYPYFCAYIWVKSYGISTTKALVEMKNIPKILYVQDDSLLEIKEEVQVEEEKKFEIEFDKSYYDYKIAIMEDKSIIYCDEKNSSYISEENLPESWLKLQAMNFVNKVYKLTKETEQFILPEDLYVNVLSSYVNDEKIDDEKLKDICEISGLSDLEMKKVYELYPYFCAYVIGEKNSLSIDSSLNIVEKVRKMLNNEENSFQNQENTVVLNMPKNNEIIDKFLNRLNQ